MPGPGVFDFLIVGGGLAAVAAVDGIREVDPTSTIGLLTEDRKGQGLVLAHSVLHNFALPNLRSFSRGPFVDPTREQAEQAMDEIAERLGKVVEQHGPEALAVSTSGWNTQSTHSLDRRFMNLLGSPNWISGGVSMRSASTATRRTSW